MNKNDTKYKAFGKINLENRAWPDNEITSPPRWCSVDLRDGNQALINPMSIEQKTKLYKMLVEIGFKEIEIGFPSASKVEYDFLRKLIDEDLIPDDVYIQVLCQARSHLIEKTFEAMKGAKNVIFHIYNSTSIAQRKIVFKKDKQEIIDLILIGIDEVKKHKENFDGNMILEYSPESFTGTELEFAKEICDEVINRYNPSKNEKVIINLPATVELSTANIYADMMEWMSTNLNRREQIILSAHAHNDRGCAIAATELSLLAGTQRVEGTLLGNGERTGNVDIMVLAMNLYTQGIWPNLDFSNLDEIEQTLKECTEIETHIRHPYIGSLVYTAFSGSHQDAIKKGMLYQKNKKGNYWEVPYLPIDPDDVNRNYEDIIRINSQSGKGGVTYILEQVYGYFLSKKMQIEFGKIMQLYSDKLDREINKEEVLDVFTSTYINTKNNISFISIKEKTKECSDKTTCEVDLKFSIKGDIYEENGSGNGPIDAVKKIIQAKYPKNFTIIDYTSHAKEETSEAQAVSYINLQSDEDDVFGVGIDTSTSIANVKALFSAINRLFKD